MRWLATSILCLLTTAASAENIIQLPTALYCGENNPANEQEIKDQYGEVPFVAGRGEVLTSDPTLSYQGELTMYLDPEDMSYSIFLRSNDGELMCLVITGENLTPIVAGDDI